MLVLNNSTGLITVPATHLPVLMPGEFEAMSPEARKRHEGRLSLAHGSVQLVPGTNEVNDADWNKLTHEKTGNGVIRHCVDSGMLVPKAVASVKDLSPADAIATVKGTGDLALLAKWREVETRRKVLDAIDAQKSEIEKLLAAAAAEDGK